MSNVEEQKIHFFYEEIDFKLEDENHYLIWLSNIFSTQNAALDTLNYIFCSDDYLLEINKKYLNHDYYTDIISFPYTEHPKPVKGDIFISVDRVQENALKAKVPLENELNRVMAHGILHFLGYKDKTDSQKEEMRKKEEEMMFYFSTKST